MIGFLPVDKPGGITSHDVVDRVRRTVGIRKVGHAGTLDPMATGLVVCAIGPATRLIRYVQDLSKVYEADACFGLATDTLDADGVVTDEDDVRVTEEMLTAAIPAFLGETEQIPPMVSAVKIGGERLYEKARRGEDVERPVRTVRVESFELVDLTPGTKANARFLIECGKGTYVRTLIDDLAQTMGTRAHLTSLRRLRIGGLDVETATDGDLTNWENYLQDPATALGHLPSVMLSDPTAVQNGRPQDVGTQLPENTEVAMMDNEGRLLAVYHTTSTGVARPEVVLPQ